MRRIAIILAVCFLATLFVLMGSRPLRPMFGNAREVKIAPGEGIGNIAAQLYERKVIRSPLMFTLQAFLSGKAGKLKPGIYFFPNTVTIAGVLERLVAGRKEITVTIREGNSVYEIDDLLSRNEVIRRGELVSYVGKHGLEGKLFPDTYRFLENSGGEEVAGRMSLNFEKKVRLTLGNDRKMDESELILASIIQNEVPEYQEQRVVAGILRKRAEAGMPLQADASLCYDKEKASWAQGKKSECDLHKLDFQLDSPYNTYRNAGFPPTPIGNPGMQALRAVLEMNSSPYWYYISDPKTKKTIFAVTLREHNRNVARYLMN